MIDRVYSFNSELFKITGVQKVLMDVHHAIMGEYDAKIVGTVPYDKLHKDLQNVGNTSYNINGITYDDGSNISEAIKTLVNAAVVERRM